MAAERGTAEQASLREDYLNQVQRDFLSRTVGQRLNTPSGWARMVRHGEIMGQDNGPHQRTLAGISGPI